MNLKKLVCVLISALIFVVTIPVGASYTLDDTPGVGNTHVPTLSGKGFVDFLHITNNDTKARNTVTVTPTPPVTETLTESVETPVFLPLDKCEAYGLRINLRPIPEQCLTP